MMAHQKQQGFSIVELMVALLLGLFLVSGVTAMYVSSKQTYRMTDNLSRLQESLRFSIDFMSSDIRMAGYLPCRFSANNTNAITGGETTWFLDFFNTGIRGYEGGAFPSAPATGTNPGDRVAGSDALAILKSSDYSSSISFHSAGSKSFKLHNNFDDQDDFEQGSIAVVCDPRRAAIFQVSNSDSGTKTITYGDNTTISPGNGTTNIGNYGEDAQLTFYEPVIYYVARSTRNPNVSSLKKKILEARLVSGVETAQMKEEEVLEGVESMQVLYGIDSEVPRDQIVDRYVTATDVADWQDVITVRLGLLMATGEEVTADVDTASYNVAGTIISDSSTPGHASDKKLRYVVNTTINLRNRVQ